MNRAQVTAKETKHLLVFQSQLQPPQLLYRGRMSCSVRSPKVQIPWKQQQIVVRTTLQDVSVPLYRWTFRCIGPFIVPILNPMHSRTSADAAVTMTMNTATKSTECESFSNPNVNPPPWKTEFQKLLVRVRKRLRILLRVLQLVKTLAPLALLYPLRYSLMILDRRSLNNNNRLPQTKPTWAQSWTEWYLRFCLQCVEHSGAAIVKLMQWSSSRPDLFGAAFCSVFAKLQDHTNPHSIQDTHRILQQVYGDNFGQKIILGDLIGSGCIGQVYKGTVNNGDGILRDVAIKVMHPNIHQNIDTDLDILRLAATWAESIPFHIGEQIKWLNLTGIVDEFSRLLTLQLDFREEAKNLERFNANFANDDFVSFPKLIKGFEASQSVLIESFCEGKPVMKFLEEHQNDQEIRTKLCDIGIKTVCKMIFDHNFIHGDLHPGNIFVSSGGDKFILLDAGMVTEYHDDDHDLLVAILSKFIRKDGRSAAALMIKDSNDRMSKTSEKSRHEDAYMDKIEHLVNRACGEDYLMENLGSYISYICEAASTHHVMMNPTFISAALAVKVQEGVVLSLDPTRSVYNIANPMILKTEFRRKVKKLFLDSLEAFFAVSQRKTDIDLISEQYKLEVY